MAYFHSPRIVTDGLVLALDAANPKSYPGSGTTWYDLSGNGINGTLVNGPTYNSSNLGSLVFDGVNDYVNLGNNSITQFPHNSPWTFTFTGQIVTQNTSFPGFMVKGSSPSSGVLVFYTSGGNLYTKHNNSQPGVSVSTADPFVYSWTHNGSGPTRIYINGSYRSAGPTMVSTDTTNSLLLGSGDAFGNVKIFNVLKYNRQLSDKEVLQNYNALKGRFGL